MLIIGIAGGSGSGKTTVVKAITQQLKERVVVIPQDSYYKDSSHLPPEERQKVNFDHPDSIDFELLNRHLKELKEGKSIEQPVYSYITCSRSKTETITVDPAEVIIIEGILIFTCKHLREQMDIKIFVDADDDDRLMRVMARDIIERGKTVESVIERYTKTVKPMYLQFIEPSKRYADIIIPQGGHNKVAIDVISATIEKSLNTDRESQNNKFKGVWKEIRRRFRLVSSEDKAGLYITVIIHLTVIIVLAISQIGSELRKTNSFVLDFSAQEAEEEKIKEKEFKEHISKRLDDLISGKIPLERASNDNVKNIAVNAGAQLKDDRNTDADALYKDAERLAQQLKDGQKHALEEDAREETVDLGKENNNSRKEKEYSGPSVLSYSLDGRKASHLPIPAYRCMGGGTVTVIITVNPSGRVENAKVLDEVSSEDSCLREFAVRAARLSRFSMSPSAPARQTGEIVYRFIAQ